MDSLPHFADACLVVSGGRLWLAWGGWRPTANREGEAAVVLRLEQAARGFARIAPPEPAGGYDWRQVQALASLPPRAFRDLIRAGVIVPTVPGREGRGNGPRFDVRAAFAAGCVGALYRAFVPRPLLKRAFRVLTAAGEKALPKAAETASEVRQNEEAGAVG